MSLLSVTNQESNQNFLRMALTFLLALHCLRLARTLALWRKSVYLGRLCVIKKKNNQELVRVALTSLLAVRRLGVALSRRVGHKSRYRLAPFVTN